MFNLLFHNYLTRGFWGDEAWTVGISRLPLKEIITITSQDFHPPFYYFLVHFLGSLTGFQEVGVRLLSLFFFLLIPVVVYFLTKVLWGKVQVGAALLIMASPILFTYAFEARSYALLAFESVLAAYIFWQAKAEIKGRYLWRWLYFALGGVMVYTHYYAWFILASHAVYLLLFERRRLIPMLPSAFGILLAQLPWLPTLLSQSGSVKNSYWIAPLNWSTHSEFFLRVTGGDLPTLLQYPLAYLLLTLILLDFIIRLVKRDFPKPYLFLLTWLLLPTLIPTVLSLLIVPIFFYRYLIFSAIPILILAVQACQRLPRPVFQSLIILILAGQLFVDYRIFSQYPHSMRETVAKLYQTKVKGDGAVYTVLPAFAEVAYYVLPQDEIKVLPLGLVQFSGKSLLDAYVRLGLTTIEEAPQDTPYYFLSPEKQVELRH